MKDFSDRAAAVTLRTYCRPLDQYADVLEQWNDVVDRAHVKHHSRLAEENGFESSVEELAELAQLGLDRKATVAGRTLWLGGTDYAFDRPCCQFNCSYTQVANVYDLVDAAWLLLNGSGVGFKPVVGTLHGFPRQLEVWTTGSLRDPDYKGPEHNVENRGEYWYISVGDSAAAWAKAIGKLFQPPRDAGELNIDGSNCRGAGNRLAGYGWICNGFEPLRKAMLRITEILNTKAGDLLDEIDILDVVNLVGTVLSSRRSAQIALLDGTNPRSKEFSYAKDRYWERAEWRRQSNNTLLFWSKPSRSRIEELLRQADECGGDPGICNAEAARIKAPWFDGVNPCVPGHTRILTDEGYKTIESVANRQVTVWNGECWSEVVPVVTGYGRHLVEVELSDGSSLQCTENHNWLVNVGGYTHPKEVRIPADQLRPGHKLSKYAMPVVEYGGRFDAAYTHGFYCGDGFDYDGKKRTWLYGKKVELVEELLGTVTSTSGKVGMTLEADMPAKFSVPMDSDVFSRLEWFAGLLDSDGTVTRNPNSVGLQVTSVHKDFLLDVRLMLTTLGVQPKVVDAMPAGWREMPNGKGGIGTYWCQRSWRLVVNAADTSHLVHIGLRTRRLKIDRLTPNRDARRFVTVLSVRPVGVAPEVYCFQEPISNRGTFEGTVTGQCAEILLPRYGFCNLVTNCLPRFKRNFAELERSVFTVARANYRQSCVNLRDGVLQPQWHQTNEALHLCGVSLTGIVQADWLSDYQIRRLRNAAVNGAYSQADDWGMPRPKAVTTVKPEGTISKAMGSKSLGEVAEGIHKPLGKYILNWVNFSVHDPIVALLESAGYRVIPSPADSANVLVCFPVRYDGIRFDSVDGKEVNLEPAVVQLNRYLRWNVLWADHNVSCTVSYDQHEIPEIVEWLDRNWDNGFIAVSFLRRNDPTKTAKDLGHPYLPQEVTTIQKYEEYVGSLRAVDWSKVYGNYEIGNTECEGGSCPTK